MDIFTRLYVCWRVLTQTKDVLVVTKNDIRELPQDVPFLVISRKRGLAIFIDNTFAWRSHPTLAKSAGTSLLHL